MATGVDDAVTERELNEIVRDGIKNHFVWVNVCYNLYRDNPNAPWRDTFTAVAMKKNKTTTAPRTPQNTKARKGRQDSSRKVAIMSAQSTEEVRSAPSGEDLDQWD